MFGILELHNSAISVFILQRILHANDIIDTGNSRCHGYSYNHIAKLSRF